MSDAPWPNWAKQTTALVVGVILGLTGVLGYLDQKYARKDEIQRCAPASDLKILEIRLSPVLEQGKELRQAIDRFRSVLADLRVAVAELAKDGGQ